jgi:tetratricopeptide (TPR) repeat protein
MGLALSYLLARNAPAGLEWALKARTLHEEIFGTADPEALRFQAVAVFAGGLSGRPLEAVSQLQSIVQQQRAARSPYLARLLWFQGALYLRARQYRQAAEHLQEAEQLAMSSADLSFQLPVIRADLGRALLELGQLDAATGKLEAAISGSGAGSAASSAAGSGLGTEVPHTRTPAQADAHAGLALVLLKRNDPRAALVQAGTADDFWRDFDPGNPDRQEAGELRSQAMRAIAVSANR